MVLQAQLYPHDGFQQQGYMQAEDYYSGNGYAHKEDNYPKHGYGHKEDSYSGNGYAHKEDSSPKHGYGHKEDSYSDDGYYNSGSSMQMRPNPCITTPQPHKNHGIGHEGYADQDSRYGKSQSYKHHSDGRYGQPQSYKDHGQHGYDKYSNGKHNSAFNAGYETHPESYMHMGPNKYESMSYNYYAEDRRPPYYEQQKDLKNWASNGAEWTSKGIDD